MLDTNRLENVKHGPGRISARCPACAVEGSDRTGTNLSIKTATGQFTCARYPGELGRDHRREIFRIAGIKGDRDPLAERQWRMAKVRVESSAVPRKRVSRTIRRKRQEIIDAFPWSAAEAMAESPENRIGWLFDPRRFLAALFPCDAIIWTGETRHSGQDGKYAHRWKTVDEWQGEPEHTVGPMVSPATWMPETISRAADRVASAPFEVLDFDGFDGAKPDTPDEIAAHIKASMAIVRWLREVVGWQLAAILFTGGKSLHAWFHRPEPEAIESLRHTADALGVDQSLIGHPEHPCRLPGWVHHKTGQPSTVIWLQRNTATHHHP